MLSFNKFYELISFLYELESNIKKYQSAVLQDLTFIIFRQLFCILSWKQANEETQNVNTLFLWS